MNKQEKAFQSELKRLMDDIVQGDAPKRAESFAYLADHEKSGRITLDMLLEWSRGEEMSQTMYAIAALGRNQSPKAVERLVGLLEKNKTANPLFLEQILEALEKARDPKAVPALLHFLGASSWRKLIKSKAKVINLSDLSETCKTVRLAVIRALENVISSKDAIVLGVFLHDEDPLVRWHTLHLMIQSGCREFIDDMQHLAENDASAVVKEKAKIALDTFNHPAAASQTIN